MTCFWRVACFAQPARDLLLRRCDLRVVEVRDLVRRLMDARRGRLAELIVDRAAVDHLAHRQPDHERDRQREHEPRDREQEVPHPVRAEALQHEPLDQAVENSPERKYPEDTRDRRRPPLTRSDGHREPTDDRHPADPHPEPVQEADLARHRRKDDAVATREPRPSHACAPPRCEDRMAERSTRLPLRSRLRSPEDRRRPIGRGVWLVDTF